MFTGIIDHVATINNVEEGVDNLRLSIRSQFDDLQAGESIAVDGICLTVVDPKDGNFYCDVSKETLAVTTAQSYMGNRSVNVERALRPIDRFGGHIVTGHVDGICYLKAKTQQADFSEYTFAGLNPTKLQYIVSKGCIAINGVSLTINSIYDDGFSVMLIPHTLERTNLNALSDNDKVNIEYDYLAKLVLNRVGAMS